MVDFEGAIKKYIPILDKAIKEMDSEKDAIKTKHKAVEDAIENLDKEENQSIGRNQGNLCQAEKDPRREGAGSPTDGEKGSRKRENQTKRKIV